MNEGISVLIKGKNIMFKFCSEPKNSFLDLLKGSVEVEIVHALSNNFFWNDRKKKVSSTLGDKKLLHSPLYFNRNIIEREYLSSLNNSEEDKILNSKNSHPSLLISLEGHSKEKNIQ